MSESRTALREPDSVSRKVSTIEDNERAAEHRSEYGF